MRLWDKGGTIDKQIEDFVVGDDYLLDQRLVKWDCFGSLAYVKSLKRINILTEREEEAIRKELLKIIKLDEDKKFIIGKGDEDVHTKIENYLTERLPETGKKVHTGRSRNEQIILDIRLYSKDFLLSIKKKHIELCLVFLNFAKENALIPMPGRTHLQKAMPSSVSLWIGSFLESMIDEISIISSAYEMNDQSPLGVGSGYGTPIPFDREFIREILGFKKVQKNPIYVNNSRGKIEAYILFSLLFPILDLSKFSQDLLLFTLPEFGYFSLNEECLLGSSLMPNKKNPSVLEMIRARSHTFISYIFQIISIINSLPSGYNQDFQETKRPFFLGCDLSDAIIDITIKVIKNLKVHKKALLNGFTKDIFATDYALKMVLEEKIPFRDAYRKVARDIKNIPNFDPYDIIKEREYSFDDLEEKLKNLKNDCLKEEEKFKETLNLLCQ